MTALPPHGKIKPEAEDEILGNLVFDDWGGVPYRRSHFPCELGSRPYWCSPYVGWLENSPKTRLKMNIGVVLVGLVGLGFAVYVMLGIKRGWVK